MFRSGLFDPILILRNPVQDTPFGRNVVVHVLVYISLGQEAVVG